MERKERGRNRTGGADREGETQREIKGDLEGDTESKGVWTEKERGGERK